MSDVAPKIDMTPKKLMKCIIATLTVTPILIEADSYDLTLTLLHSCCPEATSQPDTSPGASFLCPHSSHHFATRPTAGSRAFVVVGLLFGNIQTTDYFKKLSRSRPLMTTSTR